MLLSDIDIQRALDDGSLTVSPTSSEFVQPASVDVRLGDEFLIFASHEHTHIDPREPQELTWPVTVADGQPFILHPGEFVLGCTQETIGVNAALAARLEGKSSLGRLGLLVHSTAGWIDPGFRGQVTLELSNVSPLPIKLWPGMRIGQLCVMRLSSPAMWPYGSPGLGSHYQGQLGATPSRFATSS